MEGVTSLAEARPLRSIRPVVCEVGKRRVAGETQDRTVEMRTVSERFWRRRPDPAISIMIRPEYGTGRKRLIAAIRERAAKSVADGRRRRAVPRTMPCSWSRTAVLELGFHTAAIVVLAILFRHVGCCCRCWWSRHALLTRASSRLMSLEHGFHGITALVTVVGWRALCK